MVGPRRCAPPLSRDPDLPTTGHAQDREGSAVGVGSLSRLRPARAPGSAGARRDPREEPHRVRRRLGVGRRRRHPERYGRHHARRRDRSGHEGLSLLGRDQHQRDDRDQRELGHRHLPGRHLDQLLGGGTSSASLPTSHRTSPATARTLSRSWFSRRPSAPTAPRSSSSSMAGTRRTTGT